MDRLKQRKIRGGNRMLGNSDLGFAKDRTPLQRGRITKTLSKKKSYYNGNDYIGVMSRRNFIFRKVSKGYTPQHKTNLKYWDKWGKQRVKANEYRIASPDKSYYVITKTEYEFANYLIENNLNNEENATKYIEKENQKLKDQKEKEKQQKREAKRKREEFKNWLQKETTSYPENEKYKVARDICIDEIGLFSLRHREILVLIDTIDNKDSREELLRRIDYRNDIALKIFYHVTGIKLGSTNLEINKRLKNLTSNDFGDVLPYSKKTNSNEPQRFYIMTKNGRFEPSYGEYIAIEEFDLYITKLNGVYHITEGKTGALVAQGHTKEDVIDKFKKLIKDNRELVDSSLQKLINKNGISPLYETI